MVSVGIGCGSSNNPPTAPTETPNPTATRTPTVPIPNLVAGCARLNIAEVDLDAFNPASNSIVADLGALLANSDINANQPNTAVGCESDPDDQDCAPMFTNLGLHFSDGTPSPATQRFFRVE